MCGLHFDITTNTTIASCPMSCVSSCAPGGCIVIKNFLHFRSSSPVLDHRGPKSATSILCILMHYNFGLQGLLELFSLFVQCHCLVKTSIFSTVMSTVKSDYNSQHAPQPPNMAVMNHTTQNTYHVSQPPCYCLTDQQQTHT